MERAPYTTNDVADRSQLEAYVGDVAYPAERAELIECATEADAPEWVLSLLDLLQYDRAYESLDDIWGSVRGPVQSSCN